MEDLILIAPPVSFLTVADCRDHGVVELVAADATDNSIVVMKLLKSQVTDLYVRLGMLLETMKDEVVEPSEAEKDAYAERAVANGHRALVKMGYEI